MSLVAPKTHGARSTNRITRAIRYKLVHQHFQLNHFIIATNQIECMCTFCLLASNQSNLKSHYQLLILSPEDTPANKIKRRSANELTIAYRGESLIARHHSISSQWVMENLPQRRSLILSQTPQHHGAIIHHCDNHHRDNSILSRNDLSHYHHSQKCLSLYPSFSVMIITQEQQDGHRKCSCLVLSCLVSCICVRVCNLTLADRLR